MANIIAFAGRRKTGKSLCCELITALDGRFSKLSFASVLKDEYCREKNIPRNTLDDVLEKERYRKAMQVWGDEKRALDPYYFIMPLVNKLSPAGFYVIEDLRFIPELEVLFKLGAVPYGVSAESHQRAKRGWYFDREIDNHISETELGDLSTHTWHCLNGGGTIYNNGTKEVLKDNLFNLVKTLFPYRLEDLAIIGAKK